MISLDNEYMVCVGYASLLKDLCSKLGISCKDLSADVAVGMEKQSNEDMVATDVIPKRGSHARMEVRIVDPKYGIDGIYCCDPTWDNIMEHDSYNFALMTRTEYESIYRENFVSTPYMEIINSTSLEEFYSKMNYYSDRANERDKKSTYNVISDNFERSKAEIEKCGFVTVEEILIEIEKYLKEKYGLIGNNYYVKEFNKKALIGKIFGDCVRYKMGRYNSKEELFNALPESIDDCISSIKRNRNDSTYYIIKQMIDYIGKIDVVKHSELLSKYPVLNASNDYMDKNTINAIVSDIAQYIVSKNNNMVNANALINAIGVVYKASGVPDEQLMDKITETIAFNKKRQEKVFPKRIRINPDETQFIYMNGENKFDIETEGMKLG